MCKRTKGFTLIELIIVLVIVAFTAAIVLPKISTGLDGQSGLRSSANRLADIADYAFNRAAFVRQVHILHIDKEKGMYWVSSRKSDGQEMPVTDGLNLKGQLPEGVKFMDVKVKGIGSFWRDSTTLTFSPEGWAEPATIRLICSTGEIVRVIIDEFSGQVKVSQ
jgi:type II secretion system protein H